jgi:hypothetical protein
VEPRKPGSFPAGKGKRRDRKPPLSDGMGWDDRMIVGLCRGVWLLTVPRRIWKFVKDLLLPSQNIYRFGFSRNNFDKIYIKKILIFVIHN